MARLPYVDPAAASERVRETLAHVPAPLKIFFMMAHAETNFRPLLRLGTSILTEQKLSAALLVLSPYTPLVFMGQEYGETRPFLYFVSHGDPDLVDAVRAGRREEFAVHCRSEVMGVPRRGQRPRQVPTEAEIVALLGRGDLQFPPLTIVPLPEACQEAGGRGQAGLGVAMGRGRQAEDRAEVALPVDQFITKHPVLGHPHERVVDRHVACGW